MTSCCAVGFRFICLSLLLALVGHVSAQRDLKVTEGPLQKKHPYERILRLVKGGDDNYYVLKGSSGHYWAFGPEGERGLQIIRFDDHLQSVDTLKVKHFGHGSLLNNVFEVLVAPDGIGILTIAKDAATGIPQLQLCRPDFSFSPAVLQIEKLADMPGIAIGIDQPMVRVAYSPDSNFVLVSWRRLAHDEVSDRSLSCIVLDRDLHVVRPAFSPFKQFGQDVMLREVLILDEDHLLFSAQTTRYGGVLTGPSTIAYGLLHYAIADDELRVIRFSGAHEVPVDTRLGYAADGQIIVGGWYLDQTEERREAGIFLGRITGADSLEDLVREPFDETLRDALILREKRSGAVGIRTGYHSALLQTPSGEAMYVLHLRGEVDPGLKPDAPGNRANNSLHCWRFSGGHDAGFAYEGHSISGFYNFGREEYSETFTWRPLWLNGQWHAIATDYSHVVHDNAPAEAQSFVWSLPGNEFQALPLTEGKPYCLLAPRDMVRVGEDEWVGVAVAATRWRLVRVGR